VRKADNLPPPCADVKKSGGLNLLEPCGPVQACNGTAVPFNTNEDIATKFEQEYVACLRNEKEWFCSVCLFCCDVLISGTIIKEMPGSVRDNLYNFMCNFTYVSLYTSCAVKIY
jgi:hypothetical protein